MLTNAARQAKVVTQMGNQGNSGEGHRLICEWIWAGVIGEVREVEAWCSLSYYPWGHENWSSQWSVRPKETPPVPGSMNWVRACKGGQPAGSNFAHSGALTCTYVKYL